MFGSAPIKDVDVRTFGGKWCKNWCHALESPYTMGCKTTFPSHWSVTRKFWSGMQEKDLSALVKSRKALSGMQESYNLIKLLTPLWQVDKYIEDRFIVEIGVRGAKEFYQSWTQWWCQQFLFTDFCRKTTESLSKWMLTCIQANKNNEIHIHDNCR